MYAAVFTNKRCERSTKAFYKRVIERFGLPIAWLQVQPMLSVNELSWS